LIDIEHRSVLMCPPTFYTVRDVKNPFMQSGSPVDHDLAQRQWNGVREAFEQAGVKTETIDPVDDLEDMVFAANQAFIGAGESYGKFFVPSRMRYESREREVPYYTSWFKKHGFASINLFLKAEDQFLEGHGDLLWHPQQPRVWAGYGFRSSKAGIDRFTEAMQQQEFTVTPLQLVDETFYHLDTCFAPLNGNAAMVYPGALSESAMAVLRRGWKRLHEVSRDDAMQFVCNGVAVNGYFIASHLPDAIATIVKNEGLKPLVVDTSEFEKGGGSVFCMKVFLD